MGVSSGGAGGYCTKLRSPHALLSSSENRILSFNDQRYCWFVCLFTGLLVRLFTYLFVCFFVNLFPFLSLPVCLIL